jgi:Protein of unknown function (DUF3010)
MRVCGVEIKHNDAMICLLEKKDGLFHLPDCRARRFTMTNIDSRSALISFQETFKKLLGDYGVTHVAIRERQKIGKHAGTPLSFKLEAAIELITSVQVEILSPGAIKERLALEPLLVRFEETELKPFQENAFVTAYASLVKAD